MVPTKIVKPGEAAQYELQAGLINASPGDVIEIQADTYHFNTEINVVCDNVTIRGAGRDQTCFVIWKSSRWQQRDRGDRKCICYQKSGSGSTVGNAIKFLAAQDVTFRDVRVEWTDCPKDTNGAYGIYPVGSRNVLVDNCVSIGASDSGIYVGQSQDVIVRGCIAKQNVAGIEIENTLRADGFGNTVTDNTGGVVVFDLPGLNLTNGGNVRVFKNQIKDQNHVNFAPKGTIVADVPAGTGVILMATDNVDIRDNDVTGHQTISLLIVSFLITERKIGDKKYDPFPENVSVHNNRIAGGELKPSGQLGARLSLVMGGAFPDILFDGIRNPEKLPDSNGPVPVLFRIRDSGDATFANINIADLSLANISSAKYSIGRDLAPTRQTSRHLTWLL